MYEDKWKELVHAEPHIESQHAVIRRRMNSHHIPWQAIVGELGWITTVLTYGTRSHPYTNRVGSTALEHGFSYFVRLCLDMTAGVNFGGVWGFECFTRALKDKRKFMIPIISQNLKFLLHANHKMKVRRQLLHKRLTLSSTMKLKPICIIKENCMVQCVNGHNESIFYAEPPLLHAKQKLCNSLTGYIFLSQEK